VTIARYRERPGRGEFRADRRQALEDGKIDGFWRRHGTESPCARVAPLFSCAPRRRAEAVLQLYDGFSSRDDRLIDSSPETAAAAIRAIVKAQAALREARARRRGRSQALSAQRAADRRAESAAICFYDASSRPTCRRHEPIRPNIGILQGYSLRQGRRHTVRRLWQS